MDQIQPRAVRAAFRSTVITCLGAVACLIAVSVPIATAAQTVAAPQPARADFKIVVDTLRAHFASIPDYESGDLLTQTQIAEVLQKVHDAGWKTFDANQITKLALPDDSFLAKQFSTPAGRTFMRKIARHPGAYSQVDRLSSIARGQNMVRDLVRQRGGDKFVEYLTTTKGGRRLGDMLAGARHGVDLNKPTGRIYTANDLLAELHRQFKNQFPK